MGSSSSKPESLPPWSSLQLPTRISLLGLDVAGKSTLLEHLASFDPNAPGVETKIPSIGLNLEILQRDPLTVTSQDLGGGRPAKWSKDVDVVRENADGIVFTVDCRVRDRFIEAREELARAVLKVEETTGAPLLILANWWDAKDAMSVEEIREGLLSARDKYYEGIEAGSRALVVKKVNAKTGEGLLEGLEWLINWINISKRHEVTHERAG